MTPQDALEGESAILSRAIARHEAENELRANPEPDVPKPVPPTIEQEAVEVYHELRTVGEFWREGHGHLYFSRHFDGADYLVGSDPKWRFSQYVCGLFDMSAHEARTRDVLDRVKERMREKAPVAWRLIGDEATITKALAEMTPGQVSGRPLKLAKAAKKKHKGESSRPSVKRKRAHR